MVAAIKYASIFFIIVGILGIFVLLHKRYSFIEFFFKLEEIEEVASSSVVKDIRGSDPCVTLKMKCFYKDAKNYGDNWAKIMEDKTCQDRLFGKCFQNRTSIGRHETHVLTFSRETNIKRCICTDIDGWCKEECSHLPEIKCCLDRGKNSVLCRQ